MKIIDANVILRYFMNDSKKMSKKAAQIIESENILLLPEVIAEVVYVLEGVYNLEKNKISKTILELIDFENINLKEEEVLINALQKYSKVNLDFVDCILYSYNNIDKIAIFSFDKKLNREMKQN
ncbi:putative nucleic-acid-binding protein [Halanaerobium saccharolyticum]|uniref:Putative nucleic-acid-binding protein n=1 Tax=Halanaerobium saccharolyticum TaxID=43595 RepID=A0A4R7Z0D9_9FIRM|nr:PIN domain-containing protein [Halanaerobium saccharolyticum]RAK08439.1 putative nucleic-acid-binding protein [Halanaerobium saccharolyticum]TDW03526.1 putative nucleic-acid-binding protein [Halanaerobium saccharolyticum]TDX59931.1 putative nucleic-acid-binding protein [Halanaerobium saccharolyticum]